MVFIGDIHGEFSVISDIISKGKKYTNYIQVGDFGLGFIRENITDVILNEINSILVDNESMLYIIRGNHDDPYYWEEFNNTHSNIRLVDNEIINIEGWFVYFLGGGISIDRSRRTINVDYWPNEVVKFNEAQTYLATNELSKHVDVVVTHIAPEGVFPTEFNDIVFNWAQVEETKGLDLIGHLTAERKAMKDIGDCLPDKKYWFYGHFHQTIQTVEKYTTYQCIGINDTKEL